VRRTVDPDGTTAVRRLAVRFTGIVTPEMTLTTHVRRSDAGAGDAVISFSTTGDGAPALGGGQLELGNATSIPAAAG
jgi:hypothetical protein